MPVSPSKARPIARDPAPRIDTSVPSMSNKAHRIRPATPPV
jgi:hypothetical protein